MRPIHSVWKVQEGSRYEWKVQCPCGVLTFKTKRFALDYARAAEALRKNGHGC
jgi:hypothetical protein